MNSLEETLKIPLSTLPALTRDGWLYFPATLADTMHYMIEKGLVSSSKLEAVNGRAQLTVWPNRALHESFGMGPNNQSVLKEVELYLKGHGLTVSLLECRGNDLWVFKAAP